MPVLEKEPVIREKAQLIAQNSALEADLNASYERFRSQTTSSRSLNYGQDPQEAKNLPRPESYVTLSQTPRISRELNLPPGRPDREPVLRLRSPVTALKTETRSPINRSRLHLGMLSDDNEAFLHQLSFLNAARALPSPPVTSTPATNLVPNNPPVVSGLVTNNPPATNNPPTTSNPPAPNIPTVPAVMTITSSPPAPNILNVPAVMTITSNPPAPNIPTVPAVIPVTNNAPISVPLPSTTPNLFTPLKRDVLTKLPKALQFDGRSN
ncbi:putative uncharacterized protein ENSP00000383309 [Dreissena polymorpha]|nr:putative uncharacterized protein ENSP00000383309 [Dreissena polymorpha]